MGTKNSALASAPAEHGAGKSSTNNDGMTEPRVRTACTLTFVSFSRTRRKLYLTIYNRNSSTTQTHYHDSLSDTASLQTIHDISTHKDNVAGPAPPQPQPRGCPPGRPCRARGRRVPAHPGPPGHGKSSLTSSLSHPTSLSPYSPIHTNLPPPSLLFRSNKSSRPATS